MKKFISILLCFSLSLLSMPFAFAANESIDPYAELKESVYNQLKAQNALGHYEFHIAYMLRRLSVGMHLVVEFFHISTILNINLMKDMYKM